MNLSKELRAKTYRLARKHFAEETDPRIRRGMCFNLQYAYRELTKFIVEYDELERIFPELKMIKPDTQESFWWPLEDTESRIKAFCTMINLVENESI